MRKKLIMVILIMLIVCCLSGCYLFNFEPLPTYECELNEQDGIVVTVEGVEYKAYPELKWREQRAGEKFAEADGKDLYLCKDDPERNFIFIWDEEFQPLGELHYILLYRTDKEIPSPSAESVDELYWSEYDFKGSESYHEENSKFIYDKEIIKTLFDELNVNQDTQVSDARSFDHFSMSIYCSSTGVPGADYYLSFQHFNGKLVCGNYFDGYVEFSLDVLEEIAGHEIDLEALLAEY